MQNDLIPIGKMAKINHISVATLRFYEEKNLLTPAYISEETGYRYYSLQQNARLDLIATMKDLGMSLKEIQQILEKENINEIEEILVRKREQMYQEIRDLKNRIGFLEESINSLERYRKAPTTGIPFIEYIDRRYFYGIPCEENFYEKGILSYEKDLGKLRNTLLEEGMEKVYCYPIGTSIEKEDFLKGKWIPDSVFILSKNKIEGKQMQVLDSSLSATIYARDFQEEKKYLPILLEFLKEHSLVANGDYLCEILNEFNLSSETKRNMFLRLSIPVSFTS